MSLKVKVILILLGSSVFGLMASMSSYLLDEQQKRSEIANNSAPVEQAQLLAEVIMRIREEYVDALEDEELIDNAIEGMLKDLDSHSRLLGEDDYEDVRISTTGQYVGIGLDISLEEGEVRVVAPLDDTPAQRAGILPGDVVIAVDDVAVDTQNTAITITRMRGRPGTPVSLDVMREGADESLHFALTRAPIYVKTVQAEYLGDGYGYIRLNGFTDNTGAELEAVARELVDQQELRGVVLDMRNNPGGVLDAAVEVADVFLERGLIVRGKGRIQEARFEEYANPGDIFSGIAVAVLVNRGSASASEIVAGALKDHHRARIVGEQTYGKGSVQTIIPLSDGRALKLTTSHYLTPSGQPINGTGIKPDYAVSAQNATQRYRGPGSDITPGDDTQLQEALRVIGHNSLALSRAP